MRRVIWPTQIVVVTKNHVDSRTNPSQEKGDYGNRPFMSWNKGIRRPRTWIKQELTRGLRSIGPPKVLIGSKIIFEEVNSDV